MIPNVTQFSAVAKVAGSAMVLVVAMSAPLAAQDNVRDRNPDAADVALTPLSDLNLARDPIPRVLWEARLDPYTNDALVSCAAIRTQVANLDAVLGDDVDATPVAERDLTAAGVAQGVVGMLIPFRGIIREVSGANDQEFEFRQAIVAGMMRRAYLKGLGEARDCEYPARPMPEAMAVRLGLRGTGDGSEEAEEGVTPQFVSQPVVQPVD